MTTKSNAKSRTLNIRFLFGRSIAGLEFQDEREMQGYYLCQAFGNRMEFCRNEIPPSPFI